MPSLRKIEAGRLNGAKARGLKTPAGIANSSLNALKHGLSAKTVVLPGESQDEYDAILNEYLDEFQPQSIAERDAVEQLATAKWRARRFAGVETAAISNEIENMSDRISARYDDIDDTTRIALAFRSLADSSRCLHLLDRYNSTAHREYERFLQRLIDLRILNNTAADETSKIQNEGKPENEHLAA